MKRLNGWLVIGNLRSEEKHNEPLIKTNNNIGCGIFLSVTFEIYTNYIRFAIYVNNINVMEP